MMFATVKRPVLLAICAIALVHAAVFIGYQKSDWGISWTDQAGYMRLGEVLATRGSFTRYPDSPTFVPEVIRTPGYPVFVAAVYRVAGPGQLPVAVAQAVVFALLAMLTYALARRVAAERVALGAGLLTALYPMLPYFGALVLTELWTTFVATAAMLVCLRAVQQRRLTDFALAGALFSATTLVRPVFVLLPFGLAMAMPVLFPAERRRAALGRWGLLAVVAALTLAPWFTYNYVKLGQFTLAPAGGVGRGLWEGVWQGRWSGRTHSRLTALAGQPTDDASLDIQVRAVASEGRYEAGPMLEYVHEWRDLRAGWEAPTDPMERATARVQADSDYLNAALAHMRADPWGHLTRRLTSGTFFLWAADLPIRYSDINATPPLVIRAIWLAQVVLLVIAGVGAVTLFQRGQRLEVALLMLPMLYVTAVHLPMLCDSRLTLPQRPLAFVLAAVGMSRLWSKRG